MSVKIKLGEEYQLVTDSRQYSLQKFVRVDKDGKEVHNSVAYFHSLEGLHKHLVSLKIKNSDCNNFKDLATLVNEMESTCKEAYKQYAQDSVEAVAPLLYKIEVLEKENKKLNTKLAKNT